MKHTIALLTLFITISAQSADVPRLTTDDTRPSFYNAGDVTLDAFASGRLERLSQLTYGGGIGATWYPFRAAGIGLDAVSEDVRDSFVDELSPKLVARLPWNRFALNFGIGSTFNFERDDWAVFAEAGPELKLTKELSLFGAIRGVRPIEDASKEHVRVFAGVRLTF